MTVTSSPFARALEARVQYAYGIEMHRRQPSRIAEAAEKNRPSVPGILAEDRNRGLQALRERRCNRPVIRDLDIKRGL
ncbi:hypothetical protein [Burkholderia metallica]|uniref:hypothetical protein n=1 Tax=Burkholderia metallica TaxID=488729 RepID=UPI00158C5B02|nr:hypothetical protein [Burkholderia metallica]